MNWISRLIYSYMQHFDKETPVQLNTITYKSMLTQKKLHKKTDAIFSIYG